MALVGSTHYSYTCVIPTLVVTYFLANRDPEVMSVHKYIIQFFRRIYGIIIDGPISVVRLEPE